MDRRVVPQLVGETLREAGILTGLFVPLDSAFSERPLTTAVLITVGGVSLAAIACGILMEAKNR